MLGQEFKQNLNFTICYLIEHFTTADPQNPRIDIF